MSLVLGTLGFVLLLAACALFGAFMRAPLVRTAIVAAVLIVAAPISQLVWWPVWLLSALALAALCTAVLTESVRLRFLSAPMLRLYQKITPQISETEQIALEAGTVGFEGELFSGNPDWNALRAQTWNQLSAEEQAFLDGPCETLLSMVDDWQISHELADLPPEVWAYLKEQKFFGMIIPKQYGGLGFSAVAHSAVLQKVASMSGTLASTVAVPNSLGPAELLLHYGTEEQKNHYLPRLAAGEEIPCFALTSPHAGSDATSIPDIGVVCKQTIDGREVLGVRLNFSKRYITLAPVATVVGLAFKLHDPEHLLSEQSDRGITLALIPRNTPGLQIGLRHLPLNVPFQNGPVRGRDVFITLDALIGGPQYIGQGWRMLVECLSVGRSISLPSNSVGAMKMAAFGVGAYARIRKQFNQPIGRFEGVEEALARIAGYTYAADALATATASAVDRGEKPAVPSAIAKYHTTELARQVISDAMDVAAGKGVILGPMNWLGRMWQGAPISVTVEGANILTRSLIIFGQGAIRCHPYILKEMSAASIADPTERLATWDRILFEHVSFAASNAARAFLLGVSFNLLTRAPGGAASRRFYRKLTRYSSALALIADVSMLTLGGKLKVRERLSARLGDVLAQLYIGASILKRYADRGEPAAEQALFKWAMHDCVYKIQRALDEYLANFPVRPLAWALRWVVFPLGRVERPVGDGTGRRAAAVLLSPSELRDRLTHFVYTAALPTNPAGQISAMLPQAIAAEPIERKLIKALRGTSALSFDYAAQLRAGVEQGVITQAEADLLALARADLEQAIAVDEFEPAELPAALVRPLRSAPPSPRAAA